MTVPLTEEVVVENLCVKIQDVYIFYSPPTPSNLILEALCIISCTVHLAYLAGTFLQD